MNLKRIFTASLFWFLLAGGVAFANPESQESRSHTETENDQWIVPATPVPDLQETETSPPNFLREETRNIGETAQFNPVPEEIEQLAVTDPPGFPYLRGETLRNRQPIITTAHQLEAGEVITLFRYRQFIDAENVTGGGFAAQPTLGVSWGVTDNLELTFEFQTVDNAEPGFQGPFRGQRFSIEGNPNIFQEATLQGKYRLWENNEGTQAVSAVAAVSIGERAYSFTPLDPASGLPSVDLGKTGIFEDPTFSAELPFTFALNEDWQITLSPKVAFFDEDNALYFFRPPLPDPGEFGTTLGIAGAASYRLNSRLSVWGDAFLPVTGNNTIDVDSGLPDRAIVFNTGIRYLVNPRLSTDLFLSNALGNTGPLSLLASEDTFAFGVGLTYIPPITSANRDYPASFEERVEPQPFLPAGFGFFDGGTVSNGQLVTTVQGGSQGILTAIQYGLLDDFELGVFLDYISGTTDESEFGVSGKIRLLHQPDGDPLTLSGLVTFARSNNVLINLINDDADEFDERGFEKGGFAFTNEGGEDEGELLIVSLSAPMHYQFNNGIAVWLTPTLGFIQRVGLEVAGITFGGSYPVSPDLDVIAEAGFELSGQGNTLVNDDRESNIPWTLGVRWDAASLLGINPTVGNPGPQVEAYITNRVGSSPFHSLRVRGDNEIAVGVGLVLPIEF